MSDLPILVAGGGPVGLVSALGLARQGFNVEVFEAEERVNDAPRASTNHPATLEMLADLGLIDDVIRLGLVARTFQFWDRPSRKVVAEFDHAVLKDDTRFPFVVQCEQHKLANLVLERLRTMPNVKVHMRTRVAGIAQDANAVHLTVEQDGQSETISGRYLIGADGGRSTVRKSLGIEFEGYTFPERFLVLTADFDFTAHYGVGFRAYFSDPDEWANLFKVSGPDGTGLWRAVFPTRPGDSDDVVFADEAAEQRLQKFFPKEGRYTVVHRNIYNVHQRVAKSFRQGRVFLAGDSAHVNNPIGGLGLNCGIHDAVELTALLTRVLRGEAPESALDGYDARRRPINIEYVQQQTVTNKKRLEEKDEKVRQENFDALRRMAEDPVQHRAFLLRTSLLASVGVARAA